MLICKSLAGQALLAQPKRVEIGCVMRIEHLISTMGKRDFTFVENTMKCLCDAVVVNQKTQPNRQQFNMDGASVTVVSTDEIGLANSRNMLLDHAGGDIEIIGDDDLTYAAGYQKVVEQAYTEYPDADIIVFQYSKYPHEDIPHHSVMKESGRIRLRTVSRVRSIEITFRRESVQRAGLRFDRAFGLGAKYRTGEENIFVADAIRAGLKVLFYPAIICTTPPTPEERKKFAGGFDVDFFKCKGACFYRIYLKWYLPYMIGYLLSKRKTVLKGTSFLRAVKYMNSGRKEYLRTVAGDCHE